eukprot:1153944-Pleurochrysis_carterae.AAC.1
MGAPRSPQGSPRTSPAPAQQGRVTSAELGRRQTAEGRLGCKTGRLSTCGGDNSGERIETATA